MAPEFPPRLVVFTFRASGEAIVPQIENVEPMGGARLRVRWSEIEQPPGYRPVGSGALYVEDTAGVTFDGPRAVKLDGLAGGRFRWIQGTPADVPWIMIAVVLPPGFSLRRPRPAPTSAKDFDGRVAVYWCLQGDAMGRTAVEWELYRPDRSAEEEARFLNSRSSLDDVPLAAGIDLDTRVATGAARRTSVFLCHAAQDKPRVRELYAQLKRDGFDPWLDEEDILPGEAWEPAITKAMRSSDVVLVCLSKDSVAKAGFRQREIAWALHVAEEQPEGAIFIIPLRLDDCAVPERLAQWQSLDYYAPDAHGRLLRALRKRALQLQPA